MIPQDGDVFAFVIMHLGDRYVLEMKNGGLRVFPSLAEGLRALEATIGDASVASAALYMLQFPSRVVELAWRDAKALFGEHPEWIRARGESYAAEAIVVPDQEKGRSLYETATVPMLQRRR